jgi:hypothetical protein
LWWPLIGVYAETTLHKEGDDHARDSLHINSISSSQP